MEPKHLLTIRWTQPYATDYLRPYLRNLQEKLEESIEVYLEESSNYQDAKEVIERIKASL